MRWTNTKLIQIEVDLTVDNALQAMHDYRPVTSSKHTVAVFFDTAQAPAVHWMKKVHVENKERKVRFGCKHGMTFSMVANKFHLFSNPDNIDSIAVVARGDDGLERPFVKADAVQQILNHVHGFAILKVLVPFVRQTSFPDRLYSYLLDRRSSSTSRETLESKFIFFS